MKTVCIPQLMSIPEAIKYFGLSDYALRKGIKNGTIPALRIGNDARAKYYICAEKFQEMIQTGTFL